MKLNEFFSPQGEQDYDKDIDWFDDLKFFIDNEPDLLNNYFFPAIKKHAKHLDHPKVHVVYIKPLEACLKRYCETFDIEKPEEKFPMDGLIQLAKKISEEQKKHIEAGDYETK